MLNTKTEQKRSYFPTTPSKLFTKTAIKSSLLKTETSNKCSPTQQQSTIMRSTKPLNTLPKTNRQRSMCLMMTRWKCTRQTDIKKFILLMGQTNLYFKMGNKLLCSMIKPFSKAMRKASKLFTTSMEVISSLTRETKK